MVFFFENNAKNEKKERKNPLFLYESLFRK